MSENTFKYKPVWYVDLKQWFFQSRLSNWFLFQGCLCQLFAFRLCLYLKALEYEVVFVLVYVGIVFLMLIWFYFQDVKETIETFEGVVGSNEMARLQGPGFSQAIFEQVFDFGLHEIHSTEIDVDQVVGVVDEVSQFSHHGMWWT